MKTRPLIQLALRAIATTPILLFRRAVGHERHKWLLACLALGLTAGVAAVLAAVWPDWIETFGTAPDGGDGSLEWTVTAVLVALGVFVALLVWRKARIGAAISSKPDGRNAMTIHWDVNFGGPDRTSEAGRHQLFSAN